MWESSIWFFFSSALGDGYDAFVGCWVAVSLGDCEG
jgi:hypothetical protein